MSWKLFYKDCNVTINRRLAYDLKIQELLNVLTRRLGKLTDDWLSEAPNVIERILCAAIHYKNFKPYEFQPINVDSGIVVTGHRHGHCFYTLKQIFPMNTGYEMVQGFLTSKNRFVDRTEAFSIAAYAKQIVNHECYNDSNDNHLISENLY